ncbi:hypothetical protein DMJ13_10785 [halophilic archaeon]|nr:hypothetical protein DMJ13_10785 [halophilic archaeon]
MSPAAFPSSSSTRNYVATVVGVIATGVLCFYSALTQSGPTVDEIVYVMLAVLVRTTIADEIARRWN